MGYQEGLHASFRSLGRGVVCACEVDFCNSRIRTKPQYEAPVDETVRCGVCVCVCVRANDTCLFVIARFLI